MLCLYIPGLFMRCVWEEQSRRKIFPGSRNPTAGFIQPVACNVDPNTNQASTSEYSKK
jgi:hypothetical protein